MKYSKKNMVQIVLYLGITSLIFSCSSPPTESSQTEFAHFSAEHASSGGLGRILHLMLPVETTYDKYQVCIENNWDLSTPVSHDVRFFNRFSRNQVRSRTMTSASPERTYGLKELITETQVSYFLWFSQIEIEENARREIWNQMKFYTSNNCDEDGVEKLAIVKLPKITEDNENGFSQPEINCKSPGGRKSCHLAGAILGLGSTGRYNHWTRGNRVVRIGFGRPAFAKLSPYVNWRSLAHEVEATQELSSREKDEFEHAYQAIAGKLVAEYEDLQKLVDVIQNLELVARPDGVFSRAANEFFESRSANAVKPLVLSNVAFNTLIHEVGHSLGMDHADNPGQHSVVFAEGSSGSLIEGATTEESVMAYGDPFLYLTRDDRLGVNSLYGNLHEYIGSL